MENSFFCYDPIIDSHPLFSFNDINYYYPPGWTIKAGQITWLVWTGEKFDNNGWEEVFVKGMIELQVNPHNGDEVWLKFFEVAEGFRNRGLSKIMIADFVREFNRIYPGKTLVRSRPSENGKKFLRERLTAALTSADIKFEDSYNPYDCYDY